MSVVIEGICSGENGKIRFGNYTVKDKIKNKIEINGDEYGVKTHNEVTRLEKNGKLLFEAVPGAAVFDLEVTESLVAFSAEGKEATQITLEILPSTEYKLTCGGVSVGNVKTNRSGKVNFSVELSDTPLAVKLERCEG